MRERGFSAESQQPTSYIDILAMSLRSDLHTSHSLQLGVFYAGAGAAMSPEPPTFDAATWLKDRTVVSS